MKTSKRISAFAVTLLLSVSSLGVLAPTFVSAAGNNCTWTGASNDNFNTAGNWSSCGGTVPSAGDNLVFDATSLSSNKTLTNDISGLSVATITFQGTNNNYYAYTIAGTNSLTVTSGIVASYTGTFTDPITLGSNVATSGSLSLTLGAVNLNGHNLTNTLNGLYVNGVVSGSGNIVANPGGAGGFMMLSGLNTWTGALNIASGAQIAVGASGLGNASNVITVASGGNLAVCTPNGASISNPITIGGTGISNTGAFISAISCGMGGGDADTTSANVTLAGTITLTSDTTFSSTGTITITGPLHGAYALAMQEGQTGRLVINSSDNQSKTPNGNIVSATVTTKYEADSPSIPIYVSANNIAVVTGAYGDAQVYSGGIIKGTGRVGTLTVDTGGIVAPGLSPGCLTSGNLTENGTFQVEIGGTTACTQYDQLVVVGTVNITNGTLNVSRYNGFKPVVGQKYVIINNDGTDAVTDTFAGLAQGATFTIDGYTFSISYKGGDGNDVELTVTKVATSLTSPNTGFALITTNPIATTGVMICAAIGIAYVARRTRKLSFVTSRRR
jgi:hypothetical protein